MSPQNPLILIIDDEEAILQTLKDALADEAYRVSTLSDGNKALDAIGKLIPDLVLLDIFMPNCNGLKLLTQIKKEYPDQKVIIISGFGTIPIAIEAIQNGAIDFIEKPLNLDEILNKIDFLKKEAREAEKKFSYKTDTNMLQSCSIVGASHLFLELIQQTERLAPHNFPIIIYGEHGAGKTILAHYIHKKTTRKTFETINCESQFGQNSLPPSDTIFLKQINKLSLDNQTKLLTLLEKNRSRIIASSTQSLFHLMQNNQFNSSLFAFLNKAPLEVPPLRKRPYDIPLLINHYLNHFNTQHKKRVILTTQSIRLLRNYQWPGNIYELKQIVENIVIHAEQDHTVITPDKLVPILGEKEMQFIEEQSLLRFNSLDQATTEFKKNFLRYLLRKNHYDIEQVSHRLNLSPVQLKNKLLELKINTP